MLIIKDNLPDTKVLIHCNVGASRSASIVIAYYILIKGQSFEEALDFVLSKRACVKPNPGFR